MAAWYDFELADENGNATGKTAAILIAEIIFLNPSTVPGCTEIGTRTLGAWRAIGTVLYHLEALDEH